MSPKPLPSGAEATQRREEAPGRSRQLGWHLTPSAGGPTHLQVLKVGQGLAVGKLGPRVAVVELVANAADVAHHGYQEVHTCGMAGPVHSCPHPTPRQPGVASLWGSICSPTLQVGEEDGGSGRERMPGQDAVAGIWGWGGVGRSPGGWAWGLQLLQAGSGLGSYHMRCWDCRSPSLSTPLWRYLGISPGNTHKCGPRLVLASPGLLPKASGAWNLPVLFNHHPPDFQGVVGGLLRACAHADPVPPRPTPGALPNLFFLGLAPPVPSSRKPSCSRNGHSPGQVCPTPASSATL